MSEKCREFFHKMPHSWEPELDKYRDLSVQAVDLLDFISRVNIFLTWLTKEPGQVQSESIEKTWNWLETEIDSCEYLFLADYRINAIRNTVAEGVLASSDVLRSIRQRRTLSSLIPHHRAARRSAMAIAMASAVVHQYQVDIEDLE
jgi:hypothetical protein